MPAGAVVFGVYLLVGMTCLIIAVASRGKQKRAAALDATDGTELGAGMLLFAAVLWPVWLLIRLFRSRRR